MQKRREDILMKKVIVGLGGVIFFTFCSAQIAQSDEWTDLKQQLESMQEEKQALEIKIGEVQKRMQVLETGNSVNDEELKKCAADNALEIGAGHCFVVILRNAYPINVLNAIKDIQEVCSIYCASANPVEIIAAETQQGRGIMGVIDGSRPKGIESADGIKWRKSFLRKIGYKV